MAPVKKSTTCPLPSMPDGSAKLPRSTGSTSVERRAKLACSASVNPPAGLVVSATTIAGLLIAAMRPPRYDGLVQATSALALSETVCPTLAEELTEKRAPDELCDASLALFHVRAALSKRGNATRSRARSSCSNAGLIALRSDDDSPSHDRRTGRCDRWDRRRVERNERRLFGARRLREAQPGVGDVVQHFTDGEVGSAQELPDASAVTPVFATFVASTQPSIAINAPTNR